MPGLEHCHTPLPWEQLEWWPSLRMLFRLLFYGLIEAAMPTRSAWICTRNDVLGNLAVVLAALGVFGSWPAVIVAAIMWGLALQLSRSHSIALRAAGRLGSRLVMFARLLFDHGLLV